MKRYIQILLFCFVTTLFMWSCIEDGVSTNSAHQPSFNVDTLRMGEIFTDDLTPTSRFTVYNHSDKIINISSISLREGDDPQEIFRLNVDGFSGRQFSNVEIRPNDSIFVFVEALAPENPAYGNVEINSRLDFVTIGQTRTVVLNAVSRNAERLHAVTLTADTRFEASHPYIVYDSLIVEPGVTLTLDPGTELLFHSEAYLRVKGSLKSEGTAEHPVVLQGDRTGWVATNIPYEIMSGQWGGVVFDPESGGNRMAFTTIKNTEFGVGVNCSELKMVSSRLRNSKGCVLTALNSRISALGCEFAEAAEGVVWIDGGEADFNFCTFSNNYLFSAITGPAIGLWHIDPESDNFSGLPFMKAKISNSIIYGIGSDISHGDLTGTDVFLYNCILRSAGSNDDNFIDCLWDTDPMFLTVRSDYYFDYRVKPDSPATGIPAAGAMPETLTHDPFGQPRDRSSVTIGAYEPAAEI